MYQPVIFREYDVRGVYNQQFDDAFAETLAQAYAVLLQRSIGQFSAQTKICVGYDARESSVSVKNAVIRGLVRSGLHVFDLGLVTSPITYFSTFEVPDVAGAIMVTGSHNPPEYNGFKISIGKQTIFGEAIQELKRIVESGKFLEGAGSEQKLDIFPSYLARYAKEFGQLRPIKVILDCGNGAAGCIVADLFRTVGLQPEILFEKPDGRFPNHHPDPTVEKNLVVLRQRVLDTGADVGIAFDGDADRIGVLDENGRMLYGDELMVLLGRSVLKHSPGAKIIGDVKCSDRLFADIEKHGGQPIMWKTGHSLIKEKIKIEKAPFGGEMSGHVFFSDRNYGYDDALYAGLRVCEILSQTGSKVSRLLDGLPTAFNTPEIRIDTTEEKKIQIVEKLRAQFPAGRPEYKVNLLDGIRISFQDGWALARASNTQPVLVLRFESSSEEGLKRIRSRIEDIVNPCL